MSEEAKGLVAAWRNLGYVGDMFSAVLEMSIAAALAAQHEATVRECAKVVDAPGPLKGYAHLEQNTRAMIRDIREQLAAAILALIPAPDEKGETE